MRYIDLGAVNALNEKNKIEKERKRASYFRFFVLAGVVFLFFMAVSAVKKHGLAALMNPVSIVTSFVSSNNLSSTDGRTNVLVLGVDRRSGQEEGGLTDTILVGSLGVSSKDLVMISLPRDLWVKLPDGSFNKINAVYTTSVFNKGKDSAQASADVSKVIEYVLGIPVHYYVVVDFEAFKKVIDILGGVDITVESAFEDFNYPIEGMENAEPESARYQHVKFEQGLQRMDAERALIYARSRKGTNGEGTDFARAKRQQNVINAVYDKLLSTDMLLNPAKLKDLYDTYNTYVETNINFATAQKFFELVKSIKFDEARSIVLDDRSTEDHGGLLYKPEDTTLYGGAYVLIPKAGDFSQIHSYVQKLLLGEN